MTLQQCWDVGHQVGDTIAASHTRRDQGGRQTVDSLRHLGIGPCPVPVDDGRFFPEDTRATLQEAQWCQMRAVDLGWEHRHCGGILRRPQAYSTRLVSPANPLEPIMIVGGTV